MASTQLARQITDVQGEGEGCSLANVLARPKMLVISSKAEWLSKRMPGEAGENPFDSFAS